MDHGRRLLGVTITMKVDDANPSVTSAIFLSITEADPPLLPSSLAT